ASSVVSNVPLPSSKNMLPDPSAAGPAPAIQNAPRDPFGVTFNTLVAASVAASKDISHPVYGSMSQCDVHAVTIAPFNSSSPARSSYCLGSKVRTPPELPAPVPETDALIVVGPPNSSAPVDTSSACRRCT